MKFVKRFLITILIIPNLSIAQVGIGTSTPRGALDVVNPSQGVILSKVTLQATMQQLPVINPVGGSLEIGTLVFNTATINDVVPGFYFWNGSIWESLKSDGVSTGVPDFGDNKWDINGNGIEASNFLGTKNNMPIVFRTNNTRRMTLLETGELVIRDTGLIPTYPAYLTVTSADNKNGLFSLSSSSTGSAVFARKISGTGGNALVAESSVASGNPSIAGVFKSGGSTSFHYSDLTGISVAGFNYGISSRFFGSTGVKAGYHSQYGTTNNWYFGGRNGTTPFVSARLLNQNKGFLFSVLGKGTLSTIVSDNNNNSVAMHAVLSPENKITDYGSGQLLNGKAHIEFDDQLKNVIDTFNPESFKIFIQLEGDCRGVFISKKSNDGFEVTELQKGKSNVKFSYTIVAKRKNEIYYNETEQELSDYSGRFIPITINK